MSNTQHQFRFIREMELAEEAKKQSGMAHRYITHLQNQGHESGQESLYGKLVYCHFRNVKEQTQSIVNKAFSDQHNHEELQLPKRDQRCYFKDSSLRIYSRGGSEFIVPMLFEVEDVFPIENGLIVKVRFDKDKLFFDPTQIKKDISNGSLFGRQANKEWTYVTIADHPLEDIHPLAFKSASSDPLKGQQFPVSLIKTQIEILHVSYKIPLIVFYNPNTSTVIFGLIKRRNDCDDGGIHEDPVEASQQYIRSIEPESRNPDIFNMSKNPQLFVEEIYSINVQCMPTKVLVSNGMVNPFELNIALFLHQARKLEVYQCDIRQPKIFSKIHDFNQVQDVVQMRFISQTVDSIETISREKAFNIQSQDVRFTMNLDLHIMKKRLERMTKQIIVLDQIGKQLHVYQGACQLISLDMFPLLDQYLIDKGQLAKATKIEAISQAHGSNVTISLNNGSNRRINLQIKINDFLVASVMKALKLILPQNVFLSLNQDYIETLMKCNLQESQQLSHMDKNDVVQGDQFQKLSALLLAILTGDHSSFAFMSKQQIKTSNGGQAQNTPSSSTQNTPQAMNPKTNTTPTQALQTKILRSSTTSFGADSMANRRKPITTSNQPTYSQISQQSIATMRPQILGRQASSGVPGQQQPRKFVTTSSSNHHGESSNFNFTQAASSATVQHDCMNLSANPFADLLNSSFHQNNFESQFVNFFPPGMNLSPPVLASQIQYTEPLQLSPTKVSSKGSSSTSSGAHKLNAAKTSQVANQQTSKPTTPTKVSNTLPQQAIAQQQPISIPFRTKGNELMLHFQSIFQVLHLMYEDLKLNKLRDATESARLAKLLFSLATLVDPFKKAAFIEYYIQQNRNEFCKTTVENELKKAFADGHAIKDGIDIEPVPKIVKHLENCLSGQKTLFVMPYPLFFERTRKVSRIYEILNNSQPQSFIQTELLSHFVQIQPDYQTLDNINFSKKGYPFFEYIDYKDYLKCDKIDGTQNLHLFEKILFTIKEEALSLDEIKKLPSIVSLPILEIIRYARLYQQEIQTIPQWPDSLYKLIQREDILNNLRLFERTSSNGAFQQSGAPGDISLERHLSKKFALARGLTNVFSGHTYEELQQEEHRREMETNIMKTAADFISGGEHGSSNVAQMGQGLGEKLQNNKIMDFLKNRFASDTRYKEVTNFLNSTNENIVKLDNIPNKESLTEEQLTVEKQKLLDKMFLRQLSKCVGRGALQFGTVQTLPTEILKIPKINQTGYVPINEQYMQVEFKDDQSKDILQWPEFHNGVASALKIALSFNRNRSSTTTDINQVQHTRNWIMYHKPQEPKYEHGGFCLAMGLLGLFDTLQPTDIYQHLKSTHDATTIGILLGRAASKIGTMDDHDTRTLCIHIPYLLPPTLSLEVSLSVQAAAVIGAGLLYKGTSNRLMTEMLLAQIGRKPLSDKAIEREGYALASGIALGLVNLGVGNKMQGLIDLKLDERLIRYVEGGKIIDLPQSMLSQNFNNDNTKCSAIKEGDMVNVHITSQGALIALALIHLKSNNQQISDSLQMPQTFYSLESVRPSFLLLKVLCKNLILWDKIECSDAWIDSQIPSIIKDIYTNDIMTVENKYQQKQIEDGIDYSTVALCYVNIVAGAVFSLGFKYAGTGNKEAFKIVQEYCHFFRKLKIMQSNKDSIGMVHTNVTKNQVDKNTVECCLCVSAFAMSMIMAGTGDVECFRTLRVLRKRFEHEMNYGFNMAINMSLGFLFLGSGAFTFSRSNLAIASLICSLYPVFPTNPSDNRYHLQALRHFYVLAMESRLLQARDIDSGEFLNIAMKVEIIDEEDSHASQMIVDDNSNKAVRTKVLQITTPDIINGKIFSIMINNEKYHDVRLKFSPHNSDKLEVEDNSGSDKRGKILDRKQKFFEQFDFQRIVYVKKKNATQVATSDSQNDYSLKSSKLHFSEQMSENAERISNQAKILIEDANSIQESVAKIKEPTIETFHLNFANIISSLKPEFSEIEEVLLSQSREHQMSSAEFFRIQDFFEQVKSYMEAKQLPMILTEKLILLKKLQELYHTDQLELFSSSLDLQFNSNLRTQCSSANLFRLYQVYQNFKCGTPSFYKIISSSQNVGEHQNQQIQNSLNKSTLMNANQIRQACVKMLTCFHSISWFSMNDLTSLNIDIHELQIAKMIVDQILQDLKSKGQAEAEIVKRYKFQKSNGLRIDGSSENEINEMLRSTLGQLFADKFKFDTDNQNLLEETSERIIDEILLPVLVQIEK